MLVFLVPQDFVSRLIPSSLLQPHVSENKIGACRRSKIVPPPSRAGNPIPPQQGDNNPKITISSRFRNSFTQSPKQKTIYPAQRGTLIKTSRSDQSNPPRTPQPKKQRTQKKTPNPTINTETPKKRQTINRTIHHHTP